MTLLETTQLFNSIIDKKQRLNYAKIAFHHKLKIDVSNPIESLFNQWIEIIKKAKKKDVTFCYAIKEWKYDKQIIKIYPVYVSFDENDFVTISDSYSNFTIIEKDLKSRLDFHYLKSRILTF